MVAGAAALALLVAQPASAVGTWYTGKKGYYTTNSVQYVGYNQLWINGGASAYTYNGPNNKSVAKGEVGANARLFTSGGSLACQRSAYSTQKLTSGSYWSASTCTKASGNYYSAGQGLDWWGNGYTKVDLYRTVTSAAKKAAAALPATRTNASGETYGSALAASADDVPDLILATASNGAEGYVKDTDLTASAEPSFTSPEEALAWQEEHADGVEVPVYASDGETPVGTFTVEIGGGSAVTRQSSPG
ncbi:hypothetical protein P9139_06350 [Curtobacterium flaccumfaciens]|nr:hypothetical protein P9139_06350 [Curtobacterium flaccumfaciens]